ncbi:MAG TPA: prepilin peptidase [Nitrospiria bacterium]|jgi:leader peptidase (prepilin peptidase)/N-methyltransferase|nr:prepilin peptidase [Nitrospiria bacterium]
MTTVYLVTGVLGALIGSFLNVCIYRIPRGESIIRPRSRCPHCQSTIRFYDNFPILSFLILRGRCRQCRAPISWRYPLVEMINTGGYLFLLWKFGLGWQLLVYALLFSALVVITFIDLSHRIVPDRITLPGMVVGALAAATVLPAGLVNALIGIFLGGGLFYLIAMVGSWWLGQEAMGGGDIKLIAMIGAFLGWKDVLLTIFIAALTGSIIGLFLMIAFGRDRKDALPFGPFLALGAVIALCWGSEILLWYSQLGSS